MTQVLGQRIKLFTSSDQPLKYEGECVLFERGFVGLRDQKLDKVLIFPATEIGEIQLVSEVVR